MQVIDIPSSPEPQSSLMPRNTRNASLQHGLSKKRPRLSRESSVVEVIELTDSDDDLQPQPGPSQPKLTTLSNPACSFGRPDSQILTDAPRTQSGPSQQHVARQDHQGEDLPPLFLPGSDNEHHVVYPLQVHTALHVPDAPPVQLQPVPPEPAAPQAPAPVDPIDEYFVRVLEVVPDVQPSYALELIEQYMHSQPDNVIQFVLHALLENASYPKVDKKSKHERDETNDPNTRASSRPKIDYASKDRVYNCGPHYFEHSLEQLMMDFPRIPKPHIRSRLFDNRFYAPTYLLLAEELRRDPLPFKLKSSNSVVGKGKGKARHDPDFDSEREWVLLEVTEMAAERDAALAAAVNEQEYEENGEGIECGCCFSTYPFDQMIQCSDAHLFCKSCMTSYASNLLGEHNPNIVCMDQSGCRLPFPESELSRFLSSKLLELYYRVNQRKEIEAAGLENLEECPFCEYKCVIDNEMEKLFRCENVACSAITCRVCKKPDHLPKNCKEAEEDKHLDAQHVIEEAMTQALMRNCPKCQKSFIKEMGCNKMTCPNCRTVSCYICRKIIDGYDHFSNPPPYSGRADKSKCNLWDPVEQRHAEEVSEAAKRALAELRKSRPDVDESIIKVDIPVAKAPSRPRAAPHHVMAGRVVPAYANGAAKMEVMHVGMGGGAGMAAGGAGIPLGLGGGAGAGAGMQVPLQVPNPLPENQFVFGAGYPYRFAAPAQLPLPPQVFMREAPLPEPAIPVALARGRRVPAQPAVAAAGGGRRRKGR